MRFLEAVEHLRDRVAHSQDDFDTSLNRAIPNIGGYGLDWRPWEFLTLIRPVSKVRPRV